MIPEKVIRLPNFKNVYQVEYKITVVSYEINNCIKFSDKCHNHYCLKVCSVCF